MSTELKGSCLCGQVRYRLSGPLTGVLNCHCSMCRKAHGSAFRTRAAIGADDFRWTAGAEFVARYESSPGTIRTFCSVCGSNLISEFPHRPEVLGLALGTLDDDPGVAPRLHVFVGAKAPWHEITDDLPQYDTVPDE